MSLRTDPGLFLTTERNVVAQRVVLINPNLVKKSEKSLQSSGLPIILTVPASRADETLMHWFASSSHACHVKLEF